MSSTMSELQKIAVSLPEKDLAVEPGGTAQLVVTLLNQQDTPDRLMLEVEGVDMEWYNIPIPAVNLPPGGSASERVVFRLARTGENRAGAYPFLVRVQAMETGEIGMAQATLHIAPYHDVQLELTPRREVATFFQPLREFAVSVSNLGNTDETLDLYATEPEDGCAFEYDTDRVSLKPGQSQTIPLAARPRRITLFGSSRLFGFNASARSVADAYVSASAHGQIEARPLVSPLLGIFLILAGFGSLAAFYMLQPPPQIAIRSFAATQVKVKEGTPVTLTWDVQPSDARVILRERTGDSKVEVNLAGERTAVGSHVVEPKPKATVYTLVVRHQNRERTKKVTIDVIPRPAQPKPVLESFVISPVKVHQGEQVILSWGAKGVSEFILDPGGVRIGKFERSRTVTPDQDTTYTLQAMPLDEKYQPVMKTVKVAVVSRGVCLAEIAEFRVSTATPYVGDRVKLSWRTNFARVARVESGPDFSYESPRPGQGSVSVAVTAPTTFTLTATDRAGNSVTGEVKVNPKPRPIPPPVEEPVPDPNAPAPDNTTLPPNTPPPSR